MPILSFPFHRELPNPPSPPLLLPQRLQFEKAVTMLANFRNYLHYHVKASKTYLHMRMRGKVKGWLQVLNKSHHEKDAKDAKTASGKTFKRMST
jgi:hypothetical protein